MRAARAPDERGRDAVGRRIGCVVIGADDSGAAVTGRLPAD
jgi:hypothetical protein